jgi:predicted ABC-type ATPase
VNGDLDRRPLIVALAGPNGAGKTTFYEAFLRPAGLRFINADLLTQDLALEPYAAAELANALRRQLAAERESFIFETVFSDPVGDKLGFLKTAAKEGYTAVLCFIGLPSPDVSEQRVAIRVSQGGHDVPTEKLAERFPRTLVNLKAAIRELPNVWVFDNGDLEKPFRKVAVFQSGRQVELHRPVPAWLRPLLPSGS